MRIQNNSYKTFNKTKIENNKDNQRKDFNEYLKILDNKIDGVIKNFEYYDIIKITQTVDSSAEFAYKYSKLLPYEALIINSESFNYGGAEYTRGDLLLKMDNGDQHIKTETSGFYYPSKVSSKEGSYTITYQYSNSGLKETGTIDSNSKEDVFLLEPAKTITVTGIEYAQQQPIYGFSAIKEKDLESITFYIDQMKSHKDTKTKKPYKPIIKTYISDGEENAGQELICDYEYTITEQKDNKGELKISGLPKINLLVVVK